MPIPVAARSMALVCGPLVAGIAGSNPTEVMDVCLLCVYVVLSCVVRGISDHSSRGVVPRVTACD
jgi:hypothetical protein